MRGVVMLKSLQHDLTVLLVLLGAGIVLGVLLVGDFRAGLPKVPAARGTAPVLVSLPPLPAPEVLFAPRGLGGAEPVRLGFDTTHFQPAPPPPRKPPTTRKVDLVYLGFLQAGEGPRLALVLEGDAQRTVGVGSNLVANLSVAAVERQFLVVTNTEGSTNQLGFREKTVLEVPAP